MVWFKLPLKKHIAYAFARVAGGVHTGRFFEKQGMTAIMGEEPWERGVIGHATTYDFAWIEARQRRGEKGLHTLHACFRSRHTWYSATGAFEYNEMMLARPNNGSLFKKDELLSAIQDAERQLVAQGYRLSASNPTIIAALSVHRASRPALAPTPQN